MKPVIFHDEALSEFDESIAYYESEKKGLGQNFYLDVERAVKLIERYPQIGAPYKSTDFRLYALSQFPYIIFYLELLEATWIAAIAHCKRKPDYWRNRNTDPK